MNQEGQTDGQQDHNAIQLQSVSNSGYKDPYADPQYTQHGNRPSNIPVSEDGEPRVDAFASASNALQKSDTRQNDPATSAAAQSQFKKSTCYGPTCITIRRFFNYIGAGLGLINSAMDIVYIMKSPYYSKLTYVISIIALIIRMVLNFGVCQYYFQQQVFNYRPHLSSIGEDKYNENDESQDEKNQDTSVKQAEIKKQGFSLYTAMHFLYYTGFYRILASQDFPIEISLGYTIDLFSGILPMLFLEIYNNANSPGSLNGLQSLIIVFKLMSLLNFIVEIIVMIWEIRLNYKMRKLGMDGFEKITEEERRRKYGRKYSVCGIISFILYLLIVIVCFAAIDNRTCDPKHSLELGVCVPCDELCNDCSGDATKCNKCITGFYPHSGDGQCQKCDAFQDSIRCLECAQSNNDIAMCTKCAEGYVLNKQENICVNCDVQHCAACEPKNTCQRCAGGYLFDSTNSECINCGVDLHHCMECDRKGDSQFCVRCNTNIATMDRNKKCTNCQGNWKWEQNSKRCKCDPNKFFENKVAGDKCQTCHDIIPECDKCKVVNTKPSNGFYLQTEKKTNVTGSKDQFVVCIAAKKGMVKINKGRQTYFKRCDQAIKGCINKHCNHDGTDCIHCQRGWYQIFNNQRYPDGRRKKRCGHCGNTNMFGEGCRECRAEDGCLVCAEGFSKLGYKCRKNIFAGILNWFK